MTTKEFIKMLQDADPSGNAHIRMEGGIPYFAELKAGYWDGSYTYIDDKGNYVTSTKGEKVDIWCMDIDSYIEKEFDLFESDNWENIKRKIKFELTYSDDKQRKEKEDSIINSFKKSYDEWYKFEKNMYDGFLLEMIENAKKGWKWYQRKNIISFSSNWKIYNENGGSEGNSSKNTTCIVKSGLWEKKDNKKVEGYYEWVYKGLRESKLKRILNKKYKK